MGFHHSDAKCCGINQHYIYVHPRAGAERRARVLIPEIYYTRVFWQSIAESKLVQILLHPGLLTEHCGIQACPNSMSWMLDVEWFCKLCACARFERVKTGNQQPPDWLRQQVYISLKTSAI